MSIVRDYETLLVQIEDSIAVVTVNREKKLNALNSKVLNELKGLLESILLEDKAFSLKGMILIGAGEKAFIAGADIREMSDMTPEQAKTFGELGQEVTLLFEKLPIPVIACVNGYALGGGCEMAMSGDFIYATENAVFGQPEVKLGLIPGFGGTQRLSRLIGRNRAKEMIYSGRNMKAEEAFRVGLVVKLFSNKEELMLGARQTLELIKEASPKAVCLSKKVLNEGSDLTIEQGLACELNQFAAIFDSGDMREGTKAFVEKRAPQFTGR